MLRHSDNVHVVTRVEKNLYRLPLLLLFARPKFILKCRFGLFFNYSETTTDYWYFL